MIKKNNIKFHELIGLDVEITKSISKPYMGIKGKIIDEKKNVFLIETQNGEKIIPKKGCVFQFKVGNQKMNVEGEEICYSPEDRIKKVKK
ncbi:MAG: ribonuclease P protein subunit [Candidatus Micrarchaeia archaeon]